MLISYKRGQTSVILRLKLRNSTTGLGVTGLTFSSSGLRIGAIADNEATSTAYTSAGSTIEDIATRGTFATPTATKCRFKEVDATNHPGIYEIQLDNTRYAVSNAKSLLVTVSGVTGMAETDVLIPLRDLDPYDATRAGLAALPNAAAEAAGGLFTRGTGAGQIAQQANGQIDVNLSTIKTQTVTCSAGVTVGAFVGNGTAALAVNASGRVDVGGWMGLVPNALTSGRVDSTVGAMQTDTLTAAALATDAVTEIKNAIFAGGSIDGYTLEQSQRLILAAAAGKASGGGSGTIVIRAANDSKDRITANGDGNGNRSTVILDAV